MTDFEIMIKESDIGDLSKYIDPFKDLSGLKALSFILEVEEIISHERD